MSPELTICLPRPIAFVLSGGASSTAAQIGMLRALNERGLHPDLIVGTSAGALNGAILADDPVNALARLSEIWSTLETAHLIPDTRFIRARNLAGRRHLYSDAGMRRLFERHIEARNFEELDIEFACVATDLDDGGAAVIDNGDLLSALLASCAIPGVFPAVIRGGRTLVDGVCVANLPVRQAVDLGAATVVLLDGRPQIQPLRPRGDVRDVVSAAFSAFIAEQTRVSVEYATERVAVLQLPGQFGERLKAFDFQRSSEIIVNAYEASVRYLDQIPETSICLTTAAVPDQGGKARTVSL